MVVGLKGFFCKGTMQKEPAVVAEGGTTPAYNTVYEYYNKQKKILIFHIFSINCNFYLSYRLSQIEYRISGSFSCIICSVGLRLSFG